MKPLFYLGVTIAFTTSLLTALIVTNLDNANLYRALLLGGGMVGAVLIYFLREIFKKEKKKTGEN